ncbi:MAG: rRNA methylase, putative, group 3 [Acidimicrobiaceae bacterium]|nr:rRNA methylase, putative, group 3 [Acidimicrobiaceae bacterium]
MLRDRPRRAAPGDGGRLLSPSRGRPARRDARPSAAGAPGPGPRPGPGRGANAGRQAPAPPAGHTGRFSPRGADLGGEQVEGRNAVLELLRVGRREVRQLLVSGSAADDAELLGAARRRGVLTEEVDAAELSRRARTEVPQGVIALAAPVLPIELADLLDSEPSSGAPAFLVVLDGVTDPQNLGSVLRSACGAGATGVVLPRHRSAHLSPAACKAAAGAVEHLSFALVSGVPSALQELTRKHVWTVGLDGEARAELEGLEVLAEPVALVLGAEGHGLSSLARARCDVLARIPLPGPVESLNVAAAAAVACFTVASRRR